MHPALDDTEEERAGRIVETLRLALSIVFGPTTLGPPERPIDCLRDFLSRSIIRPRVIQTHDHVGPEIELNSDRSFRRDEMPRPVKHRTEFRTLIGNPSHLSMLMDERVDLIPSGIREKRSIPPHEGMGTTRISIFLSDFLDQIGSRLQIQMIRIHHQRFDARFPDIGSR
jgi:hypothetical protein